MSWSFFFGGYRKPQSYLSDLINSSNGFFWDADMGFWVGWVIYTGGRARKWVCTVMLIRWKCGNKMETNQTLRDILLYRSISAFLASLRLTCWADSVQSPIVSFTHYCLLASYNLLKEGRHVKQVWDKRSNMYLHF